MGYYIEVPENTGKTAQLVKLYGATIIKRPRSFDDVPGDKALICVVGNRLFDAAAYCYSAAEFGAFNLPSDDRPRQWLLMDKKLVRELTGFRV